MHSKNKEPHNDRNATKVTRFALKEGMQVMRKTKKNEEEVPKQITKFFNSTNFQQKHMYMLLERDKHIQIHC